MHKKFIATTILSAFLCTFSPAPAALAADTVQVTLPGFTVTLNGQVIDNSYRQYPLLVYKDITYFPMTYYDCRFLGVETDWTRKNGLWTAYCQNQSDWCISSAKCCSKKQSYCYCPHHQWKNYRKRNYSGPYSKMKSEHPEIAFLIASYALCPCLWAVPIQDMIFR